MNAARWIVAGILVITLPGCMDQPEAVSPVGPDISLQAVVTAGDCGLVKDLANDVKTYFSNPEVRDAQNLAKDLDTACKAGNPTTELATQLLEMMETALVAGRGGNTATGSNLANALLACTRGLCNRDDLPAPVINFAPAFGPAGTFSIRRGTSTQRVMARDWVKFTDTNPTDNRAMWGIDVDAAWGVVAKANPVLLYGSPSNALSTLEPKIGDLQYDFKRWPVVGLFQDGKLHVWVCFADKAALPRDPGVEPNGRMQRESVLLSNYDPDCPTDSPIAPQAASLFAPFMNVARSVVPRNMFGFVLRRCHDGDCGTRHVGGSPLDFSGFAPVAANTDARLVWVVAPDSVVIAGAPLAAGGLKVQALSGGGTPMENVAITITVQNNSGAPAGAFVTGGFAFTLETDGAEGIATFPAAAVNKPDAFTVCATGALEGFTFEPVCSEMFHARNNK